MSRRAGWSVGLLLLVGGRCLAADPVTVAYFPLGVGNWWAYEELDDDGKTLSRETWTLVGQEATQPTEFHLRSSAKRLDALAGSRRHWEEHEYLRVTNEGLHKRYPAGREAALEVMLLKEPVRLGTHWRDAQGNCEVISDDHPCSGPRGEVPGCLVVVCRLGEPASTVVTSTYARGVGMVRQEVEVLQLLPALAGGGAGGILPCDTSHGGRSVLRLTGYHVDRPR